MAANFYHIVILIVAVAGVLIGYRKGLVHQLAGVIGFIAGILCCRIFHTQGVELLKSLFPSISEKLGGEFIYSILSSVGIFVVVFYAFRLLAGILRRALSVINVGVLNSLLGSVFCALKYLLGVSILYNIILCFDPDSSLMRYCNARDGNIVEMVTSMAPALLNSQDVGDLSHKMQLKEAAKISCNFGNRQDVMILAGGRFKNNIDKNA